MDITYYQQLLCMHHAKFQKLQYKLYDHEQLMTPQKRQECELILKNTFRSILRIQSILNIKNTKNIKIYQQIIKTHKQIKNTQLQIVEMQKKIKSMKIQNDINQTQIKEYKCMPEIIIMVRQQITSLKKQLCTKHKNLEKNKQLLKQLQISQIHIQQNITFELVNDDIQTDFASLQHANTVIKQHINNVSYISDTKQINESQIKEQPDEKQKTQTSWQHPLVDVFTLD